MNSIEVRGVHTYLLFTVTHLKAAPNDPTSVWTVGDDFADGDDTRPADSTGTRVNDQGLNATAADGLLLIDPETSKQWRALYDTSGMCLCSRDLDAISLPEGESHTLYAIYPALPDATESVSVEIPEFGRSDTVPVRRK